MFTCERITAGKVALFLASVIAGFLTAQADEPSAEAERTGITIPVLTEFIAGPEPSIPDIPMGGGGQPLKGVMPQRRADGSWSPPSDVEVAGDRFGFQVGAHSANLVFVFVAEDKVRGMLSISRAAGNSCR